MLFYGGIGLLVAGLLSMFASDKLSKDPEKAAQMKKNGPMLAGVGAVFLGLAVVLPSILN